MEKHTYNILIDIARKAIIERLTGQKLLDIDNLTRKNPFLAEKRAVFITLNIKNKHNKFPQLRGCIGSILPHRSLINDIIHNAIAAAFDDPRFSPLSYDEIDKISIEVSILSIPEKIYYKNIKELKQIIIPFKHGVILKKDWKRSTFLPDVWQKLPEFDIFFAHLCQKAGLMKNCLELHPEIEIYTVEKIEEKQ
jgi:AmmeMemoRadiSam system protein A